MKAAVEYSGGVTTGAELVKVGSAMIFSLCPLLVIPATVTCSEYVAVSRIITQVVVLSEDRVFTAACMPV